MLSLTFFCRCCDSRLKCLVQLWSCGSFVGIVLVWLSSKGYAQHGFQSSELGGLLCYLLDQSAVPALALEDVPLPHISLPHVMRLSSKETVDLLVDLQVSRQLV